MTPRSVKSLSTPLQMQMKNKTMIAGGSTSVNANAPNKHDLMSPMTKMILMQKLIEVQEQIGENISNSNSEPSSARMIAGSRSIPIVDGIVAGSFQIP